MDPRIGEEQSLGDKIKGGILELIEFIAIVGVVVLFIHYFIAEPHQVSGSSMVPNFHNGEYIITNKIPIRFGDIQRGQVLIFKAPQDPDKVFIKRVIGMPTERVKLLNGKFYINDQQLEEPYLPANTLTPEEAFLAEGEEVVIPENQYFMVGDNRTGSSDSREWGPVKEELVIGEAWFRYWPPQVFGLIKQG